MVTSNTKPYSRTYFMIYQARCTTHKLPSIFLLNHNKNFVKRRRYLHVFWHITLLSALSHYGFEYVVWKKENKKKWPSGYNSDRQRPLTCTYPVSEIFSTHDILIMTIPSRGKSFYVGANKILSVLTKFDRI